MLAPRARRSWVDLAYEDLVASPTEELRRVYDELGLSFGDAAQRFARDLANRRSATSLTAPGREAWKRNEAAVERVAPRLESVERRLGYAT